MNTIKLQQAIKKSPLSQKEIAAKSGISPQALHSILNGTDPKVSTLEAIVGVVGIKISSLFEEGNIEISDVEGSFNPGQNDTETIKKLTDIIDSQRKRIDELTDKIIEMASR